MFIEWKQGSTPKEHQDRLDEQRKLEYQSKRENEDRQWREEQRRLDLEWREKRDADDKKWREDQDKKASKRHRLDLIITGIVATLFISAATIAAAFIAKSH